MQRTVFSLALPLLAAQILAASPGYAVAAPKPAGAPRQVYVTSDSAPGWTPSVEIEEAARGAALRYLATMDEGRYADAYALLADRNRQESLEAYEARVRAFNVRAGKVIERRITRITWTKDPAAAPAPGAYAAIDVVSRFLAIDRHCGYLVLYQPPSGGEFRVMREESNFMDNEVARAIATQHSPAEVDAAWAKLSAACPNYETASNGDPSPLPESPSSSIGYPSVAVALTDLRAQPRVKFRQQNGWTVAEDDATLTIWSFPPPNDPAYPSAVRRKVVQQPDGASSLEMSVLCEASKAACDNLVRTFEQLNERMKAQLQGRSSN